MVQKSFSTYYQNATPEFLAHQEVTHYKVARSLLADGFLTASITVT